MNKIKFSKFLLGLVLILLSISCFNRDDGATDPIASGEYLIDNRSSELLIFSVDKSVEIMPGEIEMIFSEVRMGGTRAPRPSSVLGSLTLLRYENGTLTTALEIDPVIDEQWNEEIMSRNSSKFTLIVTHEMIN